MNTDDKIKAVEVFAGTPWQAELLISILADADIQAFSKDGIMGTFNPWWTASGGVGAVKVMVSNIDIKKSIPIIEEFEKNL
ncbi:MAG: hypothetical protein ACOYO1_17525 [Bacteroidales bacterium]